MKIGEIKEKVKNFQKYPGTKKIKAASVCNQAYPSCFNLSLSEAEMHEEWGQYLSYDKDMIYSKIQPCIRHQDWKIICNDSENRYRYLSLFNMADVGGIIVQEYNKKHYIATRYSINAMVNFLTSLELDMSKIRIAYFYENNVANATNNKYRLNKNFPIDPILEYWKDKHKFKDSQFIPNNNRDTLLALNIFGLPTPWGYRNEIFYEHKGRLLDIGTIEHLMYSPIFDKTGEIIDIEKFKHSVAISGVGIERLAMVVNDLDNAWNIDTIAPLIDKAKLLFLLSESKSMILIQALRAIHRIIADGGKYESMNKRRKEYFRMFFKPIYQIIKNDDKFDNKIRQLLYLNSNLNPDEVNLSNSIDSVIKELEERYFAFARDNSKKLTGCSPRAEALS